MTEHELLNVIWNPETSDDKHCYKCGSTEKLSVKKRQRGIVTYMCNDCRSKARIAKLAVAPHRSKPSNSFDMEAWERRSRETMQHISQKYARTSVKRSTLV